MTTPWPLPRSFYDRDTLKVARDLIGKTLLRRLDGDVLMGRIVETEAYIGEDDPACHAARGLTGRTRVMYGPPGFSYVYFTYGMYFMLNVVCEAKGFPAAVLIRAVEPLAGMSKMARLRGLPLRAEDPRIGLTNGPGKLCVAFAVTAALNEIDLTRRRSHLQICEGIERKTVAWSGRVGIRQGNDRMWRCFVPENPFVSRQNPADRPRRNGDQSRGATGRNMNKISGCRPARLQSRREISIEPESQPLLGAHVSIAGGVQNAFQRGRHIGATAIQIFLKNASQWKARPYDEQTIRDFKANWQDSGILFVAAHDSYLINLAASDRVILEKSLQALHDELERAEQLGVPCLVMHPGSHLGDGEVQGVARVIQSLDRVHRETRGYRTQICLEGTAGQGTNLGHRLEHLQQMLDHVAAPERLGVCIDTCHLFAAGYDFRDAETYRQTFEQIKARLCVERVKLFHANDSRKGLGSRVDRHAHIGKGEIGLEAFRLLLHDTDFASVPKILETPKDDQGTEDIMNLNLLRSLL